MMASRVQRSLAVRLDTPASGALQLLFGARHPLARALQPLARAFQAVVRTRQAHRATSHTAAAHSRAPAAGPRRVRHSSSKTCAISAPWLARKSAGRRRSSLA